MRRHIYSFPAKINDFASATTASHAFFLNRFVAYWNRLPDSVVKSKSIEVFEDVLDKYNGNGCYSTTLAQKSRELL